jgi:mannosylglycerate synthase
VHVVAIPFLDEAPEVVAKNLEIAATHPSIDIVWGVTSEDVADRVGEISNVEIVQQRRLGSYRPGKGDAMNTALALARARGVDRLHFYDADITNFSREWISGAENAADAGFEVVRHSFPRAATDAMITWLITKPVMALKFPGTVLPRIGQPLGGELLLTAGAIETMANSDRVRSRSDWGIDTEITFHSVAAGHSLYEHHVSDGKRHALYGSLAELSDMLRECFDSVATLPRVAIPEADHFAEPATPVPADLRSQPGFSVEATRPMVSTEWAPLERESAAILPARIASLVERMVATGDYQFLDEEAWLHVLSVMIDNPPHGTSAHEALLFRLWVGRVLHYTEHHVSRGYDHALDYLASTIAEYEAAGLAAN